MNMASILKDLGREEEAITYAEKEINISPNNQAAYLLITSLFKECDLSIIKPEQIKSILKKLIERNS